MKVWSPLFSIMLSILSLLFSSLLSLFSHSPPPSLSLSLPSLPFPASSVWCDLPEWCPSLPRGIQVHHQLRPASAGTHRTHRPGQDLCIQISSNIASLTLVCAPCLNLVDIIISNLIQGWHAYIISTFMCKGGKSQIYLCNYDIVYGIEIA